MAECDEIMLTCTGNVDVEHPGSVHRYEGFLKAVELMRNADVAFANLECSIIDGDEWPATRCSNGKWSAAKS